MTDQQPEVRAKDVQVEAGRRAYCQLCPWKGPWRTDYPEANADRETHLNDHRTKAPLTAGS